MSASEQFILAIQTGDLLYVEKHLKRPVSSASVERTVRTKLEMTPQSCYGAQKCLPLLTDVLV